MATIHVSKGDFQREVLDADRKVLVDFWAPWCSPCRMVVPIVEEISNDRPDIKVVKINVDEEPELSNQYGIMTIPTLMVMERGKILKQCSGALSKEEILEML